MEDERMKVSERNGGKSLVQSKKKQQVKQKNNNKERETQNKKESVVERARLCSQVRKLGLVTATESK